MNIELKNEILKIINRNKHVFISAFIIGLMAYAFAFTNKLPNHDDITCLFSKGDTLTSGRWGLYLLSFIIPNYSMPWLYGIISLLMICAMACIVIMTFKISNRIIAVVLACLLVTFPAQTATYGYMFTSVPYAFSLMLSVLSVYTYSRKGKFSIVLSIIMLMFSISIYQPYLCIAAVFHVVLVIQEILMDKKNEKYIIVDGLISIAILLAATIAYYLVQFTIMHISDISFNSYASTGLQQERIIEKLFSPYRNFISYFYSGHYDLVRPGISRALHFVCASIVIIYVIIYVINKQSTLRNFLLLLCLAVFPVAVNCVCLIVSNWHNLMTWGLTGIYVLTAVIIETELNGNSKTVLFAKASKYIVILSMASVCISNVFYSNEVFLKMYLQYENAYSFYSSIVTQVKMTPGFDENSKLALIGGAENNIYSIDEIDTKDIAGVCEGLINIYSRNQFIKFYEGFDVQFASTEELYAISETEEFSSMPVYPYYGSVQKINNYIVIKLSDI